MVGLASGTGRFELYRKGPDTFCAVSSLYGRSPFWRREPGRHRDRAGRTARPLHRVNVLEFGGTFQPELPTRGYVGEFDANCNQFDCETPIRFGRLYVVTDGPPAVIDYRFVHYSRCGIWVDAFTFTEGDIAC